jgi:predicted PurR-regulated permease PerM
MSRKYFLLAIFVVALYWVGYLYSPFLMQIAIASLLALATSSLSGYLSKYCKYNISKATILTLLLGMLFFAPIVYIMNSSTLILHSLDAGVLDKIISFKNDFELPSYLDIYKVEIKEFLNSINTDEIAKNIVKNTTTLLQKSAGFLKDMVVILIFYFFVNLYSKDLVREIKEALPFDKNSSFFIEISSVMSLVFYSTLITAIFEGALFAVIVAIYGYDGLLFGILYGFASLIPVIGGVIMWIPLALYEYSNGNTTHAIVIALYSIIVISIIADTIIKPVIIKYVNMKMIRNQTKINELLIFFSILAGLTTFGFWGMILGPAITTFFISLLKIYKVILDEEKKSVY